MGLDLFALLLQVERLIFREGARGPRSGNGRGPLQQGEGLVEARLSRRIGSRLRRRQQQQEFTHVLCDPTPLLGIQSLVVGLLLPVATVQNVVKVQRVLAHLLPLREIVLRVADGVDQAQGPKGAGVEGALLLLHSGGCEPVLRRHQMLASADEGERDAEQQQQRGRGDRGRRSEAWVPAAPLAESLRATQLGGVLQRTVVEEAAQVLGQFPRLGIPPAGVGVEAPAGDTFQAPGNLAARTQRRCRAAPLLTQRLHAFFQRREVDSEVDGVATGDHFVQHHPEGIDVCPLIDAAGQCAITLHQGVQDFRGHVRQSAAQDRAVRILRVLRQVEVKQHRLAVGADQYIRRLDVSVEDAAEMGMMKPLEPGGPQSRPQRVGR